MGIESIAKRLEIAAEKYDGTDDLRIALKICKAAGLQVLEKSSKLQEGGFVRIKTKGVDLGTRKMKMIASKLKNMPELVDPSFEVVKTNNGAFGVLFIQELNRLITIDGYVGVVLVQSAVEY